MSAPVAPMSMTPRELRIRILAEIDAIQVFKRAASAEQKPGDWSALHAEEMGLWDALGNLNQLPA